MTHHTPRHLLLQRPPTHRHRRHNLGPVPSLQILPQRIHTRVAIPMLPPRHRALLTRPSSHPRQPRHRRCCRPRSTTSPLRLQFLTTHRPEKRRGGQGRDMCAMTQRRGSWARRPFCCIAACGAERGETAARSRWVCCAAGL